MSKRPGPRNAADFLDHTFGKLTPLEYGGNSYWVCSCSCGNVTKVSGYALRKGTISSCGCERSRTLKAAHEARRELRELVVVLLQHRHLVQIPEKEGPPGLAHWTDRALAAARALKEPV